MAFKQLSKPEKNDIIATMHLNCGDIKILMLPEAAPKAVENFITHAKNGYYNGLTFHRVINDFMIQGGDPTGTGCGGESIYGSSFADEFTPEAHNLRGSLSMANSGPNTNGSQFFIVQASSVPAQMLGQMKGMPDAFPPKFVEAYEKMGGTPWLDFRHTVFGQVIEGMDVVDKVAATPVGAQDKPIDPVIINGIDVETV